MSPVTIAEALFASTLAAVGRADLAIADGAAEGATDAGSIPTTSNDERDAAFFKITETLAADGLADDTALLATTVFAGDDLAAEIDNVLEDLLVAESWESMAMRSLPARSHTSATWFPCRSPRDGGPLDRDRRDQRDRVRLLPARPVRPEPHISLGQLMSARNFTKDVREPAMLATARVKWSVAVLTAVR